MNSQITDLALVAKCPARAASGFITAAALADSASNDPSASIPNPDPVRRKKFRRETVGCAKRCPNSFHIDKLVQTHQRLTKVLERQLSSIVLVCRLLFLKELK